MSCCSVDTIRSSLPEISYKNGAHLCELTLLVMNILGFAGVFGGSGNLILGITTLSASVVAVGLHSRRQNLHASQKLLEAARLVAGITLGVLGIMGMLDPQMLALTTLVAFSGIALIVALGKSIHLYYQKQFNKLFPISQMIPLALFVINALCAYQVLGNLDPDGAIVLGVVNLTLTTTYLVLQLRAIKQVIRKNTLRDETVPNTLDMDALLEKRKPYLYLQFLAAATFSCFGFVGATTVFVASSSLISTGCVESLKEISHNNTQNRQ